MNGPRPGAWIALSKPPSTWFFFFLNLLWILSHIEMKQPWVYKCSPSRSLSTWNAAPLRVCHNGPSPSDSERAIRSRVILWPVPGTQMPHINDSHLPLWAPLIKCKILSSDRYCRRRNPSCLQGLGTFSQILSLDEKKREREKTLISILV